MANTKSTGKGTDPGPVPPEPSPLPVPSVEERAAVVKKFVGELNARPDAQEQIIKDAIPALNKYFNIDIPALDMGVREHVSPAAPGPMTQNRLIDPKTLSNADAGQSVKVGPPAGGDEAQAALAVGKALGTPEGKPLDRGTKVGGKDGKTTGKDVRKAKAAKKKAAAKKPTK